MVKSLLSATGGNPLALVELRRSLTTDQLAGVEPIAGPVAVGERLQQAFARRIEELPPDSQRALLLAAAASDDWGEAGALPGVEPGALEAAERRGLLEVGGGRLRFRHPLVRAAAYHAADPAERRRAHGELAENEHTPLRRAWHLATAAPGADVEAAAALEQAAEEALARGGRAAGAAALERAAQLTPEGDERVRRSVRAAEQYLLTGAIERAVRLASAAREAARDPLLRADAEQTLSRAEVMRGSLDLSYDLALRAAATAEPHDRDRAVSMLFEAQLSANLAARLGPGRRAAERALRLSEGGRMQPAAAVMLGAALLMDGEFELGREHLAQWPDLGLEELVAAGPPLFFSLTLCLVWLEEYEAALMNCDSTIASARAGGAAGPLQMTLGQRAEIHRRRGDWAQARADASESLRLAEETGQLVQGLYPFAITLRLEAALGLREAERRVDEVESGARSASVHSILPYFPAAELVAALGRGDIARAIERGREVRRLLEERGMRDPSVIQWRADFVEALVRGSEREEALHEATGLYEQGAATGRPWVQAAAARCLGLLAEDDAIDGPFSEALEWHRRGADPFERARTELAYGERLRRAGRPEDAREQLRAALETFDRLGAEPWADRARGELRAGSALAPPPRQGIIRELTAQELEVAIPVAEGATNREVAATLFVSPKTVEAHLSRIYRKLGIRSRTELSALLSRERLAA